MPYLSGEGRNQFVNTFVALIGMSIGPPCPGVTSRREASDSPDLSQLDASLLRTGRGSYSELVLTRMLDTSWPSSSHWPESAKSAHGPAA